MSDEYIRKADVSDWLKQYGQDVLHGKYKFSLMYIWKNIMDLPSADVAPVVHAHWKDNKNGTVSCSRCSTWFQKERVPYLRFCGYCGARMDGKGEE